MMYDIKTIIKASNTHYGMFPIDQKGRNNMTFEIIRLILIMMEIGIESDFNDYKVIIYSLEPLCMKTMVYGDIPDCFNCVVHAFDIDLDKKLIFIRSEVINNE